MRELCVTGFRGMELVKVSNIAAECSLAHLAGLLRAPQPLTLVASRDRNTSLDMDLDLLRANPGVKVVWMLRQPLDVLTSVHADRPGEFYVDPERLFKSLKLYQRFKDEPQVLTIHYSELVSDPNAIQARIAKAFQLETGCDFTEAHKYFPRFDQNVRAMHSIRPIDAKSVQKWKDNPVYREYLEKVLDEHPALISLARDCGYEISLA